MLEITGFHLEYKTFLLNNRENDGAYCFDRSNCYYSYPSSELVTNEEDEF